jgi:endonuclease/exonuclease/phosphatase family metal-dependent hydrolase
MAGRFPFTALLLSAACALSAQQPSAPPPAAASCRGSAGIEWQSLAGAEDRESLDTWCDSVGPPLVIPGPTDTAPLATLVVVSWNVHVGQGQVDEFMKWLDRSLDVGRPYGVVLLLQEAVRGGAVVPASVPSGMDPPGAIRSRSEAEDVAAVARRLSLHAAYVPSMRNGRLFAPDAQQDRGNAILSTVPLRDVRAIELPFGRQRRVVVVATLSSPQRPRLRVATVHLDPSSHRATQARALAPVLNELAADGPLIVGGDLNTWFGRREQAFKAVDGVLPEEECGRGKTNTWPGRLHVPLGWWRGRLDYLFSNLSTHRIERTCRTLDRRFGSDHSPIVMLITASGPAAP